LYYQKQVSPLLYQVGKAKGSLAFAPLVALALVIKEWRNTVIGILNNT
jgi:hypothetical protein